MADEQIEVEVTVETPVDTDSDSTDDVTTSHVIDAAIDSGIAAERAADDASDAQGAAIDAGFSASDAADSAQRAEQAADETNETLALLRTLTQQNAEFLAAQQAKQSASIVEELGLPDSVVEDLNPEVDIAPETGHWLTRRIGPSWLGGRKKG